VFDSAADAITVDSTASLSGSGTLTKVGPGRLTLSGANTYSGMTTVSGGTLLVNNTSGSGTGVGSVQVASGGTLGGTGIIGGAVTVTNGGVFAPGPLAGIGTLTLSNALTLTPGSVLQYALGASNDLAVVQGALTLGGTLNITDTGGFGLGTYTLFTYTGSLTNNGVVMGAVPSAALGYYIDTSTAGQVKLLVMPSNSALWANPSPAGNWSNPLSWNPSVLPAAGADVIFGTGGSTSIVDTVSRTVGSILFNRAGNFTITATNGGTLAIRDGVTVSNSFTDTLDAPVILGNTNTWLVANTGALQVGGVISGGFPLIKTGAGSLTLSATNTFTGGALLLAGTLNVSSDSNLGSTNAPNPVTLNGGTLTVTKPFTLSVNHPLVMGVSGGTINAGGGNTITLASTNTLTGSGTLNIAGASSTVSVLAINAAQNITGALNINSGRILVSGAAGTLGTGPVTIGTGSASLYLSVAGITLSNAAINIQSNGGENRGTIRFASGGTTTGNLVLLANAGLSQEGASTVNLNGNISGGYTLQLNGLTGSGTGTWNLGGSNSVAGLTVAGGTVNVNASSALGAGGLALAVNGGALNMNTRSVTVGKLAGAGGTITDASAGAGTTMLTVNQSATTTVASAIQNGGVKLLALTKAGSGALTLSGTNTYTGATSVSAGTLLVNGSLAASAINVASNATLAGTGMIGGTVTVNAGGVFAPGPLIGTGTLTLGKALTTASGARLRYGLGASNDLAAVTGALTLGGTLDITDAGGFGVGIYTLFTYTGTLACTGLTIGTKPDASLVYTLDTNTVGQVRLVVQSTQFVAWQLQYFGSATLPQAQPDADPDGDHLSNAQEFLAGTNPNLRGSVLSIIQAQSVTNGKFSMTWQSVSGKTYRVAYTPSLAQAWLTNLPNSLLTSTGQTSLIYVDAAATPVTNRFYKINLVP
jgi:autotransporter-associated beta strand protein